MQRAFRLFVIVLLTFAHVAGCGQKGPLYLPGDRSQIRTLPEQQQDEETAEEEDDEQETPITIE